MQGAFFIPKITAGPAEYKKGGAENVDWHDKKEWRGKEYNMKLQWLKEIVLLIPYIKSRTTAQQQEELSAWVKIAVAAAEQIYTGSGRGTEKKKYVLEWLTSRNIKVDEDRLDAMIESAVYALKNS